MGVADIAEAVKEILNSEDNFTICDSKGIEISESTETQSENFVLSYWWKLVRG